MNNKINDGRENDNKLFAFAGPEQIVYEGSTVLLEGQSFPDNKKLVWKQIDGPSVVLEYENKETINTKLKNPCFRAPFISLNMNDVNTIEDNDKIDNSKLKPYTKLTFELVVKNESETHSSFPSIVNIIVKMVQRALIFQGGGSLGAYETGAFSGLCNRLIEIDRETGGKRNRPVFDIIAGSSIGAVNAAIIVSDIKERIENNKNKNKFASE